MKLCELTEKAGEIFTAEMQVDQLLVKLSLSAFKHYVEEANKDLTDLLKVYDNPLELKPALEKILAMNTKSLRDRGLITPPKLELV